MPRPRSKNAPTPAKTVDYSRVPRNEMDGFTLRTAPWDAAASLCLDNAESIRQLEYLASSSRAMSARASAAELSVASGQAPSPAGVAMRGHGGASACARSSRAKQHEKGCAVACSLMLLALAVQPAESQATSSPVTRDSVFEAHDTLTRRAADEEVAECTRGSHRTAGGVTSAGSSACRYPRRAHAVEEGDQLGKLLAPLYPWEFLLASAGGTWGSSPRHISRQDHRYLEDFSLADEAQIHELLKSCRAVSDSSSNRTRMRHFEDVKLIKGRGESRTVVGRQLAPASEDAAALPDDVSWSQVLSYYEEGYSVVVGQVDMRSQRVARFVEGLEHATGIPMRAHLQWTPPFHAGIYLSIFLSIY